VSQSRMPIRSEPAGAPAGWWEWRMKIY
jgi:hypothetical protein